jgi:hypothetical protein
MGPGVRRDDEKLSLPGLTRQSIAFAKNLPSQDFVEDQWMRN